MPFLGGTFALSRAKRNKAINNYVLFSIFFNFQMITNFFSKFSAIESKFLPVVNQRKGELASKFCLKVHLFFFKRIKFSNKIVSITYVIRILKQRPKKATTDTAGE
jgi:hypothetical protein